MTYNFNNVEDVLGISLFAGIGGASAAFIVSSSGQCSKVVSLSAGIGAALGSNYFCQGTLIKELTGIFKK
jgi:hypothetical protein